MKRLPLLLVALASPMIAACAPIDPTVCRVSNVSANGRVAEIELADRFSKRTIDERVLIRIGASENGLFAFGADLRPSQTERIVGRLANRNQYDFKSGGPCEVEHVRFADGSTWDAPTPL